LSDTPTIIVDSARRCCPGLAARRALVASPVHGYGAFEPRAAAILDAEITTATP
jgi:hypothetical protein